MTTITKDGSTAQAIGAGQGIEALLADLAGPQPAVRARARRGLVAAGNRSVPALIQLLAYCKPHTRWEAAKARCEIAELPPRPRR